MGFASKHQDATLTTSVEEALGVFVFPGVVLRKRFGMLACWRVHSDFLFTRVLRIEHCRQGFFGVCAQQAIWWYITAAVQ